jgi:hypothetical protein
MSAAIVPFSGSVLAGAKKAVTGAADPDCTVEKAAKGAVMKATVGVGNRCDAAETARDATGVDGKLDDGKKVKSPKLGKKIKY